MLKGQCPQNLSRVPTCALPIVFPFEQAHDNVHHNSNIWGTQKVSYAQMCHILVYPMEFPVLTPVKDCLEMVSCFGWNPKHIWVPFGKTKTLKQPKKGYRASNKNPQASDSISLYRKVRDCHMLKPKGKWRRVTYYRRN